MIISYNWLNRYLPEIIPSARLSKILTAIGLEVEAVHTYSSFKGGLAGLVTGEVLTCEKHADADKLKVTTVNIGTGDTLQIVCGAANVAAGQKVVVATVGTTIFPTTGEPFMIKNAKIRGVESKGMLCAEDEIGLGTSHDGIMVLDADTVPGKPVAELFDVYNDEIFEIGLTPNRMDAMSHLGVAKDVIAYINHHDKKNLQPVSPLVQHKKEEGIAAGTITVDVRAEDACKRYCGVEITGIQVTESPAWLKDVLRAIGVNPINNIVDITNFILHETGQPLHAFDATKIEGNKVTVEHLPACTGFTTLDGKERKLEATDLLICDGNDTPMCLAGVYGGKTSGVTAATTHIFLESAWFAPGTIRKTSLHHGLRTDAATRFEKGVDISASLAVLKHAAQMITEICGGTIAGKFIDVYPNPPQQNSVRLTYHYLKKLSGKNYHGDTVKNILTGLGFSIVKDDFDHLTVNVPFSKPDISLAADVVEEIMRIDGLDAIDIPQTISIAPMVDSPGQLRPIIEKAARHLAGLGFNEIFTNSITDSKYYDEATLNHAVKLLNNLSADLDVMRPQMLQTGLEVVAHNLNRRNNKLLLFENGKTYRQNSPGNYEEEAQLAIWICGTSRDASWADTAEKANIFYAKGVCENLLVSLGVEKAVFTPAASGQLEQSINLKIKNEHAGVIGKVNRKLLQAFGIREDVYYINLLWKVVAQGIPKGSFKFKEVPKFPSVQRDLALVVADDLPFSAIQKSVNSASIPVLTGIKLFDIYSGDKLGAGKKSLAVNFNFQDDSKTLTDTEIDGFMKKLIQKFEKENGAEVRGAS